MQSLWGKSPYITGYYFVILFFQRVKFHKSVCVSTEGFLLLLGSLRKFNGFHEKLLNEQDQKN